MHEHAMCTRHMQEYKPIGKVHSVDTNKYMIQRIKNRKFLNIGVRGYTSLSNIQFGYAVTRATALHLAIEALAKNK